MCSWVILRPCGKQQLHPTQVSMWKRQAIEGMVGVFSDKIKKAENNQVWCSDITYISVKNGFLYLVAIMDWAKQAAVYLHEHTPDAS